MNLEDKVKEVMEKFKSTANVKAVFGEPYEKDGLTIIPVAKVFMSGGGGTIGKMFGRMRGLKEETGKAGEKTDDTGKNLPSGWGGFVKSLPAGYIKVNDGQAEYVEIWDKNKLMLLGGLALVGMFGLAAMKKMMFLKKWKNYKELGKTAE